MDYAKTHRMISIGSFNRWNDKIPITTFTNAVPLWTNWHQTCEHNWKYAITRPTVTIMCWTECVGFWNSALDWKWHGISFTVMERFCNGRGMCLAFFSGKWIGIWSHFCPVTLAFIAWVVSHRIVELKKCVNCFFFRLSIVWRIVITCIEMTWHRMSSIVLHHSWVDWHSICIRMSPFSHSPQSHRSKSIGNCITIVSKILSKSFHWTRFRCVKLYFRSSSGICCMWERLRRG